MPEPDQAPHETPSAAPDASHSKAPTPEAESSGTNPPDQALLDWVATERMSALCAELLQAALSLGRNIVIVGPHAGTDALAEALVASTSGASRVVAPSARRLVQKLRRVTQGVGAFAAARLDQGLMRLELAAKEAHEEIGSTTSLRLLASVDLLVVLNFATESRVMQVGELVMTEAGYRPQLLFSRGLPPSLQALIPASLPTFVGDLMTAGFAPLAADLTRATRIDAPLVSGPKEPASPASFAPDSAVRASIRPGPPPAARAQVAPSSAPGWELDRLPVPAATESGPLDPDEAAMAAAHGLEPPRRTQGTMTFESAMARLSRPGRTPR